MSKPLLFTDEGQRVSVGAHVCAMHENPTSVLGALAEAFKVGLRQNERCVYIAPEESASAVRSTLKEAGTDVESAEKKGHLLFMTDREPFLKDGAEFDPQHLVDAIKSTFEATIEAGYAGLRLSADVPWISHDVPGEDRVLEFEALADEVVNSPGVPLIAICQYQLSELDPEDTIDIMERHPLTLVGGRIHTNDRYAG